MKWWLVGMGGAIAAAIAAVGLFFLWASSSRYAPARYTEVQTFPGTPIASDPDTFTVVSYNLGYLSGLTNNQAVARPRTLYAQNQATAIAALASVSPDLIAFQEIDFDARRSFHVNQFAEIAAALNYPTGAIAINWDKRYVPFPYWPPAAHFGAIYSGQALLSRFPIQTNTRIVLDKVPSNPFFYNALYLDRLAQVTQVQLGAKTLIVINVHLEAFDAPTRLGQTQKVRAIAEAYAQTNPVLLLGDFNSALNRTEGETHSIQTLLASTQLQSAVPQTALTDPTQFTFPSDIPEYTLDYVFYTPETLEILDVRVLPEAAQASDHLPLVVRLRVK